MSATQSHPHSELLLPKPPPEAFGRGEHPNPGKKNNAGKNTDSTEDKKEDETAGDEKRSEKPEEKHKPLYERPKLMAVSSVLRFSPLWGVSGIGYMPAITNPPTMRSLMAMSSR